MSRGQVAGLLGGVLAAGWAGVAAAFVLDFTSSPNGDVGDALALSVLVIGVLILAAVSAVGARAAWRAESTRRLSTGALCTVVLAGWPATTALGRGLSGILDPTGAAALGMTAIGGAVLILLARARTEIPRETTTKR